ncbi:benzoate-CoA ligase family protein [Rhodospirillum sp. A1_3_36]|uniref:benzoate-CoA ligase family protein n=1 Tax=Rhodospirillum sp. A1_3_36 TaxID=3391666 RepID=UPI0039A62F85
MPELSKADHGRSPPIVDIPRNYNAAYDLLQRNLNAGRGDKVAFIDDYGRCSYAELNRDTTRFANAIRALGLGMEHRILVCLHDTVDFPVVFLGAIKAGVVPVAVNTLLTVNDYAYMLADSRARVAVVSEALLPLFEPLLDKVPTLERLIVSDRIGAREESLARLLDSAPDDDIIAPTLADDICFWLYSSGSTGAPKGTAHVHSSLIQTAEYFARPTLGIREDDVVFSAAKLFFAYGLGNGLSFPMSVGATTVLMAGRPTPSAVCQRLVEHKPAIFYGVPTLYASMLADPDLPNAADLGLRVCTSAGEALPEELGRRWRDRFGVPILDGIGSTEMLHVFLSNRLDDLRYGTTGKPVPGYEVRLVDEDGMPVTPGEPGELQVRGPTSAAYYWNNRAKTRATFLGEWTRSGDKYSVDGDGYYVYAGRSDDMLKVGGIYVSPIEVEATLIEHQAVLECAVVAKEDEAGLVKPKAFVVLKTGFAPSETLSAELKAHVKACLAPYKYPRWLEFVDDLPKTATGKIQRFKLRG